MRLVRFGIVMLIAGLVAAVAACGDDDEGGDDNGNEPAATTPAATGDGGGEEVSVEAVDLGFDPEEVAVPADVEVVVKLNNTGVASHTLDVYADGEFTEPIEGAATGNVSGGEEGEFTATFAAGEYFFRCEIHPDQMQGTLTAE